MAFESSVAKGDYLPPAGVESLAAEGGQALPTEERVRLMRDGLVNCSGFFVSAVVGVLLIPFMLNRLGAESFGLWVTALSINAMAGLLDFGIGWSLTREVAAADGDIREETTGLVMLIGQVYLLYALVGAVLIGTSGLILTTGLHLSPRIGEIAPAVFGLVALAFVGDAGLDFAMGVLQGLGRFDVVNMVSVAGVLLRAAGIVALLIAGRALMAVVAWHMLVALTMASVTIAALGWIEPRFRLRHVRFDWSRIAHQLQFGFASRIAHGIRQTAWEALPLVVGILSGPAQVSLFYTSQKFPFAVYQISGRLTQVLFPAASARQRVRHDATTSVILETGTRLVLIVAVPICVVLWILGPELLQTWLGHSSRETVLVLRLTVLAALADGIGAAALQVLWGLGEIQAILVVLATVLAATLSLSAWLLVCIGAVGAALGLFLPTIPGSFAILWLAARELGLRPFDPLRRASARLFLPAVGCAFSASAATYLLRLDRWEKVSAAALVSVLAYGVFFYLSGAAQEERIIIQLPWTLARRWAYRGLRCIGMPRKAWHAALIELLADSASTVRIRFDRTFAVKPDPYGFESPNGKARHKRVCEMLDAASNGRSFAKALEVGCAEGAFTELLAERCQSLLAVDVSPVALMRARTRRWDERVRFALWDVRAAPAPGDFDLIVAMDVLYYIARPWALKSACKNLVGALRPGGYLLVENDKEHYPYENRWWAKHLLHGARWIDDLFARDPSLTVVATEETDTHVFSLFQAVARSDIRPPSAARRRVQASEVLGNDRRREVADGCPTPS